MKNSRMNYEQKVSEFLKKPSDLEKIIVIYGPTWSGKTDMSIDIAKQLDTEIISTDSRQIYKAMDIGTWKITLEETKWVKHHMLDIVNPDEEFSLGDFKSRAIPVIETLHAQWKIPMLVGWTWLYIDSLIFDFKLPQVPADENIRSDLRKLSTDDLYAKLVEIDPEYAKELHPNNRPYVERAIEVKMLTWKSKSEFKQEKKLKYDVLFLTPYTWDREALYNRINKRVGMMFTAGLEWEFNALLKQWYKREDQWMISIGYQEFFPYIDGEIHLDDVMSQIQQNSRNYAKRQLTWFSKYEKIK